MKKFFFLIFILFFVIFVSSCGKKNLKQVDFMTWGTQSEIIVVKKLIKDFEKENPTVKVNLIHVPENYFQKLHLLVASNLMPDVIFINNLNSKLYIQENKLEPLNSYINTSKNLKTDDFFPKVFEPFSANNNVYAIPRDVSNIVVYYNKDLFDKYKVSYPQDNWTFAEFLAIANKMSKDLNNDKKNDLWGIGFEENSLFWLPFLWSNGGGILNQNNEILLNSQNSKNSLQFYSDLRNKYNVAPKKEDISSLTISQMFLEQKLAMHLCGKWCSLTYKKQANFDWDVVKFPRGTNGSKVGLDVSGWAISANSKHKTEAWDFIEFLASEKAMKEMTEIGLILPAQKEIAYADIFFNKQPKNAIAFINAIDESVVTPAPVKYSEINDLLKEKFELLFNGKKHVGVIINNELVEKLNYLIKQG